MEFAEEVDELGPVSTQRSDVLSLAHGLGLEGDLFEGAALRPVKVEIAVQATKGRLGFEDAVQSGPTEEGFIDGPR